MKKLFKIQKNKGMTYVEIIVVLSIFAVMSSIVMFNYGAFQAKVDVKNYASDIALKIVEAQKSALSGKLPLSPPAGWKPSYGVYFNINSTPPGDNKSFIYFTNFNDDFYNSSSDVILDQPTITKGNYIEKLEAVGCSSINNISIVFRRPDSSAKIASGGALLSCASYVQITIKSPKTSIATIKIYPSGRIQVN